jgi:hypothetical protein
MVSEVPFAGSASGMVGEILHWMRQTGKPQTPDPGGPCRRRMGIGAPDGLMANWKYRIVRIAGRGRLRGLPTPADAPVDRPP